MKKKTIVYIKGWGNVPLNLASPFAHEVFTEGSCGALAKALNHIAGCKIIATDAHAAVIAFDGRVLDIEGTHVPSTFERKWGVAQPCNEEDDLKGYGEEGWREAIPFAKLLAEKYLR